MPEKGNPEKSNSFKRGVYFQKQTTKMSEEKKEKTLTLNCYQNLKKRLLLVALDANWNECLSVTVCACAYLYAWVFVRQRKKEI